MGMYKEATGKLVQGYFATTEHDFSRHVRDVMGISRDVGLPRLTQRQVSVGRILGYGLIC
jgi:hypothetical protein